MASAARLVTAGVVGKPHGLDGSFYVERPGADLAAGDVVRVGGRELRIERLAGTDRRPLLRLSGVAGRDAAVALRGELLLVEAELGEGEWLAEDLVGCSVDGLGSVVRVIDAPSCDLLELSGGELVPLVSDAVVAVDLDARTIAIDRTFLRLGGAEADR